MCGACNGSGGPALACLANNERHFLVDTDGDRRGIHCGAALVLERATPLVVRYEVKHVNGRRVGYLIAHVDGDDLEWSTGLTPRMRFAWPERR